MNKNPRWSRRPEGSTWGDWGPDDQIGRLNLLTHERVLAAVSEVREGRTFCLSLPLDYPGGQALNPRRTGPRFSPVARRHGPAINYPMRLDDPLSTDIVSDDCVHLDLQYSTQWDGLSHFGQMFDADGDGVAEDVYYNGYRAGIDVIGPAQYVGSRILPNLEPQGARRLGVDKMAESCVQGRGVMIDLEAHFGGTDMPVRYEHLMEILRKDAVQVEQGDFVCFHTGFSRMLLEMQGDPQPGELFSKTPAIDGTDERIHQWVTDTGAVALISDNLAVEGMSADIRNGKPRHRPDGKPSPILPLHAHCLFRLGVYLGELWNLSELASWLRQSGRSRFLLTAPPLRLPGAVGSAVTPVATV